MNYFDAVILGIVEGLTEFLPISSTGHLTIAEKLLGLEVDDPAVTGFTAVIQMGAIAAVILYFRKDIWRIATAWVPSAWSSRSTAGTLDHRMGWYVIVGSIPIGDRRPAVKDVITGPLRSLWVVGDRADRCWSAVMWLAERRATPGRAARSDLTMRDAVVVGLVQCVALVPGVSRSGATISAGLFRGLDRVTATRLVFFLSIPALLAAGLFELKDALGGDIGVGQTARRHAWSASWSPTPPIAWLLRFVADHSIALVRALPGRARRAAARRCSATGVDRRRPEPGRLLQPAGLLEADRRAPAEAQHHQRRARTGSRVPAAARACGRSSCRRRRRSGSDDDEADAGRDLAHVLVLLDRDPGQVGVERGRQQAVEGRRSSRRPG